MSIYFVPNGSEQLRFNTKMCLFNIRGCLGRVQSSDICQLYQRKTFGAKTESLIRVPLHQRKLTALENRLHIFQS